MNRVATAGFMLVTATLLTACQPTSPFVGNPGAIEELRQQPLNEQPWTFGNDTGWLITTPHYAIYTTLADGLYRRLLAKTLEATHARAEALVSDGDQTPLRDCFVFATRAQWEAYTRVRTGANAPIYLQIAAGGYSQEGVFAGYDIGRERTLGLIAHEAWHQYSWFALRDRLPSWIEEGIATQNESIQWDGTDPRFTPQLNYRRWVSLKEAVQEKRLWGLEDLAMTHPGRVLQNAERQVDSYYAEVWSLTLFLQNSPKYAAGLKRMVADAHNGTLTNALAGTGVTRAESDAFTERWNRAAGVAYMKAYLGDIPTLEHAYDDWAKHFVLRWPPQM